MGTIKNQLSKWHRDAGSAEEEMVLSIVLQKMESLEKKRSESKSRLRRYINK